MTNNTNGKHQKHAKLTRPGLGQFARNEWAILGTPCGKIQKLGRQLIEALSDRYQMAYVDADHKSGDETRDSKDLMTLGAYLNYTDKIHHHRIDLNTQLDSYQFRSLFNETELVLVNGNHFKANKQIVVIDPKKADSLQRKLDRLTDVALILHVGDNPIPDYLKAHLPDVHQLPAFSIDDVDSIAGWLDQQMQEAVPPLMGLILAGGKSQRMGMDKGLLDYHGKPQRDYLYEQLDQVCDQTFMSCRPDQVEELDRYPLIVDTFMGLGPYGAILSAFREYPNHAWLVAACDLPLLDIPTFTHLIEHRDPGKVATAFNSPVNEFPEPLITIWEPRSYAVLFNFLAQGYSCPRKALINSNVALLDAPDPRALTNVNHPEEYEAVKEDLKS